LNRVVSARPLMPSRHAIFVYPIVEAATGG